MQSHQFCFVFLQQSHNSKVSDVCLHTSNFSMFCCLFSLSFSLSVSSIPSYISMVFKIANNVYRYINTSYIYKYKYMKSKYSEAVRLVIDLYSACVDAFCGDDESLFFLLLFFSFSRFLSSSLNWKV